MMDTKCSKLPAVDTQSDSTTLPSSSAFDRLNEKSHFWDCVYKIPICGGFCAPTLSPEVSALRHFSNEKTVICFVVFWKFLSIFEQNRLCYLVGPIGFKITPRMRKYVMSVAFVLAVISSILITISIAGNSTDAAALRRFPWAYGHGTMLVDSQPVEAHFYVGIVQRIIDIEMSHAQMITMVAQNTTNMGELEVLGDDRWRLTYSKLWDTGCEFMDPHFHANVTYCARCHDAMTSSAGFAIMMMITSFTTIYFLFVVACFLNIPTIATDCQRITEYGDLNCQKFFGIFCAFIGIYGCLDGVLKFKFGCIDELPLHLLIPGSSTPISIIWNLGSCWHCFFWGGLLKIADSVIHFCVPTPSGRHSEVIPKAQNLGQFLRTYSRHELDRDIASSV